MNVYLAKITNKENVEKILKKEIFTHKDIYNFENEIMQDDPIFFIFSGDKSKIDWKQGLIGFGKILKTPYEKGYSQEKPRYFKIDIEPIYILKEPLDPKFTKLHPTYQNELYDVPYVGANHFPNQAIAKTSGRNAEVLFLLMRDIDPKSVDRLNYNFLKELNEDKREAFRKYLLEKNQQSTVSSYLNALDNMPPYLTKNGVECPSPWSKTVNLEILQKAANLVKAESNKDTGGLLSDYIPQSHWNNGWFFSGVSNFLNFSRMVDVDESSNNLHALNIKFDTTEFIKSIVDSNLSFKNPLAYRFTSSLLTKPFVILTGLSGSGKTKLAEAFSIWITENKNQYCMVSVGADWTNREPLLGFPNALEQKSYIKPDCGSLDLILRASANPNRPYFLILDEMNMSHVERYFADFLSAMESTDGDIALHSGTGKWEAESGLPVPPSIKLPKNLFIIGTVNIDETTYMFSPKVLDRANVIEFRVSETEMNNYFKNPSVLDMESLRGKGASMGVDFLHKATSIAAPVSNLKDSLMPFFVNLQEAGAEFGYRTAFEISRFVSVCEDNVDGKMNRDQIVDAAIMQKLLPKVHGSRNKIEKILKDLGRLCLEDNEIEPFQKEKKSGEIKYPISYEKLERMHKRVISDGFTSYAEA